MKQLNFFICFLFILQISISLSQAVRSRNAVELGKNLENGAQSFIRTNNQRLVNIEKLIERKEKEISRNNNDLKGKKREKFMENGQKQNRYFKQSCPPFLKSCTFQILSEGAN